MHFVHASGRSYAVRVPDGVRVGQAFVYQLPAAAPAAPPDDEYAADLTPLDYEPPPPEPPPPPKEEPEVVVEELGPYLLEVVVEEPEPYSLVVRKGVVLEPMVALFEQLILLIQLDLVMQVMPLVLALKVAADLNQIVELRGSES